LLVFPFLLLQHSAWAQCKLRIFIVAPPEEVHGEKADHLRETMEEFLKAGGVAAEVKVIPLTAADAKGFTGNTADGKLPELDLSPGAVAEVKVPVAAAKSKSRGSVWQHAPAEEKSQLSTVIETESGNSDLVVISLPGLEPINDQPFSPLSWLKAVDELVAAARRVIFIHQSGNEKVQFFA